MKKLLKKPEFIIGFMATVLSIAATVWSYANGYIIAYVVSVVFMFKLAKLLTSRTLAAWLATIIYALNPNTLYMQTTPMSEVLLLMTLIVAIYFFIKWMHTEEIRPLIASAIFAFAGSLIRYDAWLLIAVSAFVIVVFGLYKRYRFKKIEGHIVLYLTPALFDVLLWLLWSLLIFNDPLYFLNSSYSAQSQQQAFLARGELTAYHDVLASLGLYSGAVVLNTGVIMCALALFGGIIVLLRKSKTRMIQLLGLLLIASPFLFNILSLFLGISILFVPGVTPPGFEFQLFNIRYGLMTLPLIAILVAYVFTVRLGRFEKYSLVGIVTIALAILYITNPITLDDGLTGLSSRRPNPVNEVLSKQYDYGYVMFDDFSRSANPISLGVPIDKIIYVGSHPYWEQALMQPGDYARWIIMRGDDDIAKSLRQDDKFKSGYELKYTDGDTKLYRYKYESPNSKQQLDHHSH